MSLQYFTVWSFSSVDGKQRSTVVRVAEPNDRAVQHEYQRILWQGLARTRLEALAQVQS